jgi:hypothetical protein
MKAVKLDRRLLSPFAVMKGLRRTLQRKSEAQYAQKATGENQTH